MPKPTPIDTPAPAPVTSGASVTLPPPVTREHAPGLGVTAARRPPRESRGGGPRVSAAAAGEAAEAFPAGGTAFARWADRNALAVPGAKATAEEWAPLVETFATRPIHGHRRGPAGGNHRPNPSDLR